MNSRLGPIFSDRWPLSLQLAQILRNRVLSGEYSPGGRIAPEVRLAEDFGVSVITVQRALKELEQEGLITRHRGRGTFVKPDGLPVVQTPPATDVLAQMFMEEFSRDTKLLSRRVVDRPRALQDAFSDSPKLLHVRRLVFRAGKPWNHASIHMPFDIGRRLSPAKFRRYPAFRLVRDLGVELKDVDMHLNAAVPVPEIATLLEINPLDPVLLFRGVLRDRSERTVVVIELSFPAHRYTFRFNMDLRQQSAAGRKG